MSIRRITHKIVSLLTIATVSASVCMAHKHEDRAANKRRVMVSMGDSYASGEGIDPFYGQSDSDKYNNLDWLAHRSENSWPGMLTLDGGLTTMADHKDDSWYFVAASGAKTAHFSAGQVKEYNSLLDWEWGSAVLDPQLSIFDKINEHVDYVTLSIGGNDMGFASIITRAVEPDFFNSQSLAEMLDDSWNQFYNDDANEDGTCIRDDILTIYRQIWRSVDPDTTIIVTGYPKLISEEGGSIFLGELISFTPEEAKLMNDSVIAFNKELQKLVRIAQQEGIRICYVSVEEEFAGHEAYSEDPYINKVTTPGGQEVSIGITSSFSMHPNIEGARAYARCVQARIDELESGIPDDGWTTPCESDYGRVAIAISTSSNMPISAINQSFDISNSIAAASIQENTGVSLVTYDNKAYILANSSSDESYISSVVDIINSGGGANIEEGLKTAYSLLEDSNIKQKVLVLVGNGLTSEGYTGQELIDFASEIKDAGVTIYTLGVYHGLSNTEKSDAENLMSSIASDGHYYNTSNAIEITHAVDDIRSQITSPRYISIRMDGPVNVSIEFEGERLDSASGSTYQETSFGDMTLLDNPNGSGDFIKEINLLKGADYDISIEGYSTGSMNYTIRFMDENREYNDIRTFNYVTITGDTIISTVAGISDTTVMNIDVDGDGELDRYYTAQPNSTAQVTLIERIEETTIETEETNTTEVITDESSLPEETSGDEHAGNFFILIIPVIAVGACIGGGIFFFRKRAKKLKSQE